MFETVAKAAVDIAVEGRRSKRTHHSASAIFYGAAKHGIGSYIYPDSQVGIKLIKAHPANSQHYLGLQVVFPRSTASGDGTWYQGNNPDSLKVSSSYTITSRYPEGTKVVIKKVTDEEFQVIKPLVTHYKEKNDFVFIQIELPDDQYPMIEGFGPVIPKFPEHRQVVENDDVVEDKERLSRILFKQRLTLLTRSKDISVLDAFTKTDDLDYTPFTYGYGSESRSQWKADEYETCLEANCGGQFSAMARYDSAELRDTALEMLHVQEFYTLRKELAALTILGRCVSKAGSQFLVHVFCPGFDESHYTQVDELQAAEIEDPTPQEKLKEDYERDHPVTTAQPEGSRAAAVAVYKAITLPRMSDFLDGIELTGAIPVRLSRKDKVKPGDYEPVVPETYAQAQEIPVDQQNTAAFFCSSGVKNEMRRVVAVRRLRPDAQLWLSTADSDEVIRAKFRQFLTGKGLQVYHLSPAQLQSDDRLALPAVPQFNLLDITIEPQVLDLCLFQLDESDRNRFEKYFSCLNYRMAVVSGPAGSGKSHIAAVIASMLGFSQDYSAAIATAPSNIACDNIEQRISTMSDDIAQKVASNGTAIRKTMSIRGYAIDREVRQLLTLLNGREIREHSELDSSPWKFRHSLCWWTARALGLQVEGIDELDDNDNKNVEENESLMKLHAKLKSLLKGKDPAPQVEGESENPQETVQPTKKPFEDFADLVRIARKRITVEEYVTQQRDADKQITLRHDISRLMKLVVDCANFVVVTPIICLVRRNSRHASNGWALVYGNSIRPAVMIGDEKQLPPVLMTMNDKREDGTAVNRFGLDAKISWLSWMLHLNIPAFHLFTQHRMARGMFDMALELTYTHLKDHFSYGPSCDLSNFTCANAIRNFINAEHNLGLPENTMSPIFVDCQDCPCREDPVSKSRYNPRATACMIEWLEKFVDAVNFPPEKIVVITPYRANMLLIHTELKASLVLSNVQTATIEFYQGHENEIVILCLAVDRSTGPCFVAQPQRLNVATSRQKLFMAVFGDIQTSIAQDAGTSIKAVTEEGTKTSVKPDIFNKFLKWFVANNRVAKVQSDPTVDPDEEWSDSG
ncbi:unnamed protein product [Fusarium equiseti]|uniref:DNA2/NAM7 helicase-like C-terminal domain-containing protein n=1 Tax=Fusarium equiseti TaxID=61235 RepID=A0A8J2IUS0_FUSEQ|nr:unnamed protein product [Fusarium equiseti]